jgi:hypothetical protein
MHRTRATGNDVRIHHHVGQSPIAIEWVIEVVLLWISVHPRMPLKGNSVFSDQERMVSTT